MKTKDLVKRLEEIQKKINSNSDYLWIPSLEYTAGCVILEDTDMSHEDSDEDETIVYNGWVEDLSKLIEELKG